MDRKAIIVVSVCLALIVLWPTVIVPRYFTKPAPAGMATNAPVATIAETNVPVTPVAIPSAPHTAAPTLAIATNLPEELMVVTNGNARYTFTSRGGGLKTIDLLKYPETTRRDAKLPATNGVATLNTPVAPAVLAILGNEALVGDGNFDLVRTETGVRAEKTLSNGLRWTKEFQISSNYLVNTIVRLENTSSEALTLPSQEWVIGTATPMAFDDKGQNTGLLWYDGSKKHNTQKAWFDNRGFMCTAGTPRTEYSAGTSNVFWAAPHNQFFTIIAMPKEPALHVLATAIQLPRPDPAEIPANFRNAPPQKGFVTRLVYPGVVLPPGQAATREISFYAGPKEYRTLAIIADKFHNNVDTVMNFGFFGFFSKALLLSMNWLHSALSLSYGWAIIAITVIIKLLFWPLTAASTRSMKRMAALAPQMKALQEKYKDDPVKLNRKTMEFWKENKVNPVGGCLPMLLQMPVFFGFFMMIQSAIELRGATFLWVADLSKPDTLFVIPGINFPFNLLPLLMGATMLWQTHLTPPSPGMDPVQQKMMRYLPLIFLVFLYNYSSGLALYWTVNNLLSILQTKLTKSDQPVAAAAPATSPVLTPRKKKKK